MSTRNFKNTNDGASTSTGLETNAVPDDLTIPNCTIEDVDRALFNLFNKDIPFTFKAKQGVRRAPVIFASGERFAVLRRKEPLRDKSGALILPLVSIMRSGVSQSSSMGAGTAQNMPMVIKKRLSADDPQYQQLVNKMSLKTSDDLVSPTAKENNDPNRSATAPVTGSKPGRVASRRDTSTQILSSRLGKVLKPSLGNNIFEVITMPPPKYFTATYEVTFWTQYTQQMNDMMMALMSLYQNYAQRTFRIETNKGYWFVAYVGDELSPGNNYDDFTDSERLVRYTFTIDVPAYIVGAAYPGAQNPLRKFVSAPQISFDTDVLTKDLVPSAPSGVPSGNPDDYILEDIRLESAPLPGQAVGGAASESPSDARRISDRQGPGVPGNSVANVGGTRSNDYQTKVFEMTKDPFTGKDVKKKVVVKTTITRKGETVLRETI